MLATVSMLSALHSAAEANAIPVGKVLAFGIYSLENEVSRVEPNSPSGRARNVSATVLVKKTEDIPLQLGTKFGFCFSLDAVGTNGTIELKQHVTHPEMTRSDGSKISSYTMPAFVKVTGGHGEGCIGYGLNYPFEVVPGNWKFELSLGDNLILQQGFVVK